MIINELKVINLFCEIDDFVAALDKSISTSLISSLSSHSVNRARISISEMMSIEILYHRSGYKCFEYYYTQEVERGYLKPYFPQAPSYNRFVQLKPRMLTYLVFCLNLCQLGRACGVYFGDSTILTVCKNSRINRHRVFAKQADRGKSSTGWFYGLKLFLVINAFGEIMNAFFTAGNIADNNTDIMLSLFGKLKGLVFADKGFINGKATEMLMEKGIQLITGVRNNMKNKLMKMQHKMLLKKRGVIESVNDILKSVCDIEHSRHRSPMNALVNLYAGICSYSWLDKKPSIFS